MECKKNFAHSALTVSPFKSEISNVQFSVYGIEELKYDIARRVLTTWLLSVEEIKIRKSLCVALSKSHQFATHILSSLAVARLPRFRTHDAFFLERRTSTQHFPHLVASSRMQGPPDPLFFWKPWLLRKTSS